METKANDSANSGHNGNWTTLESIQEANFLGKRGRWQRLDVLQDFDHPLG